MNSVERNVLWTPGEKAFNLKLNRSEETLLLAIFDNRGTLAKTLSFNGLRSHQKTPRMLSARIDKLNSIGLNLEAPVTRDV